MPTMLATVLDEQGVSQADLARRTNLSTKHVNLLCQGTARLSVDVALRLEFVLGIDAAEWMAAYTATWLTEQREAVHLAVFQQQMEWWKRARGDDLNQIIRLSDERDELRAGVQRLTALVAAHERVEQRIIREQLDATAGPRPPRRRRKTATPDTTAEVTP